MSRPYSALLRSIAFWLILVFALITRLYRLDVPHRYIFDEVYHAVTAKLILHNDPQAFEWWNPPPEPDTAVDWLHPPLAKYTQALSMGLWGENSFGWRFSSALFGVGVIAVIMLLAVELFENHSTAILAGFLASLDGLLLTQSRIAMNDIHVTFFILLTLWLYYRFYRHPRPGRLLAVGVAAGLACASKWSGVFALGIVGACEAVAYLKRQRPWSWVGWQIFSLVVVPALLYVGSYGLMFAQGKSLICTQSAPVQGECYQTADGHFISHFHELHNQIWWYQTHLTATHGYQSRPWQWFLDLRPVWYHVEYYPGMSTNIYAFGNPLLFWAGDVAVLGTVGYLIWLALEHQRRKQPWRWPLTFLLFAYAAVWLPWQLSPRIMFFYHYTPAVPLLCIILAFWLERCWNRFKTSPERQAVRVGIGALLLSTALVFALWYPQWTAWSVPDWFAQRTYFILPEWK